MYGFCRITDLGILHFNFSSRNCSSKVYTCFGKVVALVTQSTTKLSLHFFGFFYDFILNLQVSAITHKGVKIHFAKGPPGTFQKITDRPLVCTKLPGTTWGFAMWSKGQGAARLAGFRRGRRRGWPGKWGKVV
jgi:hypothetical protein